MTIALVVLGVVVYAGIAIAFAGAIDESGEVHDGATAWAALMLSAVWPALLVALLVSPLISLSKAKKQ